MFTWRVTKYNPAARNAEGAFQDNEWTSLTDISLTNAPLLEEYQKTEDAYVQAVAEFMQLAHCKEVYIQGLEKNHNKEPIERFPQIYPAHLLSLLNKVHEGLLLNVEDALLVARLVLRENLWCKLVSKDGTFFVHFGYDYYMYIGCASEATESVLEKIRLSGLYTESFKSPYA